ncbi:hypothetical protein Tco_0480934 [Tanacetum coccineum]|uniref:Uncharacterized protein n=1 Tax=Tanacetum coccineum TaxID=301880 RepID=A0ABQ5EJ24_9ASTR
MGNAGQMVKDFHLYEYNKGMETRKWSEDDKRRSKDFITAIEKRLQIKRIYQSLESFVGGRIRDIDYRLINRTNVTTSSLQSKAQLLFLILYISRSYLDGYLKDGDGDGNSQPHKGVKASQTSDVLYQSPSATDGDSLQEEVKIIVWNDLKKAQDHSQRQASFVVMMSFLGSIKLRIGVGE